MLPSNACCIAVLILAPPVCGPGQFQCNKRTVYPRHPVSATGATTVAMALMRWDAVSDSARFQRVSSVHSNLFEFQRLNKVAGKQPLLCFWFNV